MLATLAQRWKMRLAPGQKVETRAVITLRPRHGMNMLAEPAVTELATNLRLTGLASNGRKTRAGPRHVVVATG